MAIISQEELLLRSAWTYKDIMAYCLVRKSKAFEIMKFCKEQLNGAVRFNPHVVKRDSVLEYMGTDIEREMYVLRKIHNTD